MPFMTVTQHHSIGMPPQSVSNMNAPFGVYCLRKVLSAITFQLVYLYGD